jgi:hypothetical protein
MFSRTISTITADRFFFSPQVLFCTAPAEKIPSLKEYVGTVRPVFLIFEVGAPTHPPAAAASPTYALPSAYDTQAGQKKLVIEGPNLPLIFSTLGGSAGG